MKKIILIIFLLSTPTIYSNYYGFATINVENMCGGKFLDINCLFKKDISSDTFQVGIHVTITILKDLQYVRSGDFKKRISLPLQIFQNEDASFKKSGEVITIEKYGKTFYLGLERSFNNLPKLFKEFMDNKYKSNEFDFYYLEKLLSCITKWMTKNENKNEIIGTIYDWPLLPEK